MTSKAKELRHTSIRDRANQAKVWVQSYQKNAALLSQHGLYRPQSETSACGVGLIAAIDGKPSRLVVERAIEALKALWHRGAVDADGKTGDGAGIHIQIPQDYFRSHVARSGHKSNDLRLAVGMVFLPRTDLGRQERVRTIIESIITSMGHHNRGWRQVPVNASIIGDKANATRPEIEQIIIENGRNYDESRFETDLYIIRRRIERTMLQENLTEAYICSLSCRSLIYKGLFLAEQLDKFYPDLAREDFISSFAIYHQRYSTNTFPSWSLAQPFRVLAHNGEINTISGNTNWMKSHETRLNYEDLENHWDVIKPIIQPGSSDSAALDAVFEIMLRTGKNLPFVKSLMIPESINSSQLTDQHRAFYHYANAVMEPWDGPAAICAYGGRWALAGTDRNGLRPLRYAITGDNMLIVGSEAGMVKLHEATVREKGRLGPGQMIAVDLRSGSLVYDRELKDRLSESQDFKGWGQKIVSLNEKTNHGVGPAIPKSKDHWNAELLNRSMVQAGWTREEVELILRPMAEDGKEAVGSMGDDSALAVLSDHYRPLHHFFRQDFAQVTNPPIDSLRERYVMSLATRIGNLGNILDENQSQLQILKLESPILLNGDYEAMLSHLGNEAVELNCSFPSHLGEGALEAALGQLQQTAEEAVRRGAKQLILTDEYAGPEQVAMPMILATGAVHSWLVEAGLRAFTSLNVRTSDAFETHAVAVLIGVGATSVNPWLAQAIIDDLAKRGLAGDGGIDAALHRFKKSLEDGLLKIMSKMGISVISSYRGGYNFEAVGLSRSLVNRYFPGLPSRISGMGLNGLQNRLQRQHELAWQEKVMPLAIGSFYRSRRGGQSHGWEGQLIHKLQASLANDSYSAFKKFSAEVAALPPSSIRDLLTFRLNPNPISVDEVEQVTSLRRHLVAPGISLGALSPIAHETLAIAMNSIGAKSDSGEGGEDSARFTPRENGDNPCSAIKQIASGRFGVTAEYLNNCSEIEIKVAQGAKPGEGGQLPGIKVSSLIAKLRHSTPGVTLISPPPHHDIYSIEDLAQLIYDLKQINPDVKVCVKLVAKAGIGTVAAGVAKAKADVIMVSGHAGGTGASPQSSIKYAGLPWEMGLAEVHQVLTLNGLRDRVTLRTDGGIKTGRDVVIAALLGAEEFGIGTASLVAMGCIMVRQCHSNTCPVGVCTQDPKLIEKFSGSAEKVVRLFSFIAVEMREIMAQLGIRRFEELIGRTDLLDQVVRTHSDSEDLDLNPLLVQLGNQTEPMLNVCQKPRNEVPPSLDQQILTDAEALFRSKEKIQLRYSICNTDRTIGTALSSKITRQFGMKNLRPGQVTLRLHGSAGQSLGAFAVQGLRIEVVGDANDYVGKGLCGAEIILRPPTASRLATEKNAIIGNTCLYGATSGKLFAAGLAGNRFAVRNSGALAVVEGIGANGCEYMTGGEVVILGEVGDNFAAGMTGGVAFLYDPLHQLPMKLNGETVQAYQLSPDWAEHVYQLVQEYERNSVSRFAKGLIENWDHVKGHFVQIVPNEILHSLAYPVGNGWLSQQAKSA